ncbi:unnamed protein product [Urochloa humidicola]
MEELIPTAQPPSRSRSPAAAYPPWVMLERHAKSKGEDSSSCVTPGNAKTLAAATTSTGHRIQVSLGLAEPPSTSALYVELPGSARLMYALVIAAHGDSLLILVTLEQGSLNSHNRVDQFVYNAGATAADPPHSPSLSLLPPHSFRFLFPDATGILRRNEDEMFVVAELHMVPVSNDSAKTRRTAAELYMFRSGEWSVMRPRICSFGDGGSNRKVVQVPSRWSTNTVVAASDKTLCWVDLSCGVLFCDVWEDSPWLRYLPLPKAPSFSTVSHRNLRVTAGGQLKFLNIFPRCCCGSAGASKCKQSHNAYTINIWTLRMEDDMQWVMDGMVDATELWALEAYMGLPRVPLDYPIISMDEPDRICFMLCKDHQVKSGGDPTLWLLMVDMRSKTIQSVSKYPRDRLPGPHLVPSSVSYYFNSHPTCSSDHSMSRGQGQTSHMDIHELRDDSSRNSISFVSSAEPSVQASEILALFKEIPSYGLCHGDMLKAYNILSHGNYCRFRSLLGLPFNLRKDWLLVEIRNADA